jgi:hypothetical protein
MTFSIVNSNNTPRSILRGKTVLFFQRIFDMEKSAKPHTKHAFYKTFLQNRKMISRFL